VLWRTGRRQQLRQAAGAGAADGNIIPISSRGVGKCSPAAIGDYIQNRVGANWACCDVMHFDHAGESRAGSCGHGATPRPCCR
jgi:hypothetical protein